MNLMERLERSDWRLGHNFFAFTARTFERDVQIIVLGSLEAGTKYLKRQLRREETKFEKSVDKAGPDSRGWYEESYGEFVMEVSDQMRFLRNMSLVALLDRLLHTLSTMAKSGDYFAPRNKVVYQGEDDFQRIYREYAERFDITFGAKQIQWIKPLRQARNLIVHNSGEVHLPNSTNDRTDRSTALYDVAFATKYGYLVDGKGHNAQIDVSELELNNAVAHAIALAQWAADQLRKRQVDFEGERLKKSQKSVSKRKTA